MAWRESTYFSRAPFIETRLFDRSLQPLNEGTPIPDDSSLGYRDHVNVVSMGLGTYSVGFWQADQFSGKDGAVGTDFGVQVVDHGVDGTPLEPRAHVASGGRGDDVRHPDALAANNDLQLLMAYTSAPDVLFCWSRWGTPCDVVPPEDGSGASVFARALGPRPRSWPRRP